MTKDGMEQLIDQWMNDDAFRAELRRDPEGTVRARNIELNEDEWTALRSVDWSQSDEALQARVTKAS
jgi:hypothetical protein